MDGAIITKKTWKALKQRLRFKAMSYGVPSWNSRVSDITTLQKEEEARVQAQNQVQNQESYLYESEEEFPACHRMNLAMALAADRRRWNLDTRKHLKPLMRLFHETDGTDDNDSKWYNIPGAVGGLCCVCMERNKGAAFIPCGHTYCRLCSRELWLNRRSCPLCSRPTNDILDLF